MKRLGAVSVILVAVVLVIAACTSQTVSPGANIVGARDLARVGDLIFVTSSERNELRAIDTGPQPGYYVDFVRGPNPLEALSIPVLNRPTTLAPDTYWGDFTYPDAGSDGFRTDFEQYGPYLYAASPGSAEISIINAVKTGVGTLQETARLPTAAPVSALAGFSSPSTGVSTLYFATFDGATTQLQRLLLTHPSSGGLGSAGELTKQVEILSTLQSVVITNMVVLPGDRLAFSERSSLGKTGDTVVFDVKTKARTVMQFPSPVRKLVTHGAADVFYCAGRLCPVDPATGKAQPTNKLHIAPGDRLFGILDEEFCGSSDCSGVVSVDTATGLISNDVPGLELNDCPSPTGGPCAATPADRQMVPLRFGGLPVGLSIAPAGLLFVPVDDVFSSYKGVFLDALGVTTVATGGIYYWEAGDLVQLDSLSLDPALTQVSFLNAADGGGDLPVGASYPGHIGLDGGQELNYTIADGKARDELIVVVSEGPISGLTQLPINAGTLSSTYASRAAVGDFVEIENCPDGAVTAIAGTTLSISVPGGCTPGLATVRAGGAQPYVAAGSLSGYLGRTGPGQTAVWDAPVIYRGRAFDPAAPFFTLTFNPGDKVARDSVWQFQIEDNYRPYVTSVDPSLCNSALPGAVHFDLVHQNTYVAYPSATSTVQQLISSLLFPLPYLSSAPGTCFH